MDYHCLGISDTTAKALKVIAVTHCNESHYATIETGYEATLELSTGCVSVHAETPTGVITLASYRLGVGDLNAVLSALADQWKYAGIWCADYESLEGIATLINVD